MNEKQSGPMSDSDTVQTDREETTRNNTPDGNPLQQHVSKADNDNELRPVITDTGNVEMVGDKAVFKPTRSFLLAFYALLVMSFAVALDATTLSVALPHISDALGGSALEAFWSGTSFLLASTVLQPTMSSLSNILGRKNIIFLNIAFFFAGSLLAALAGNFTVLIAGRTIQGIGGGGLMALTEVVITDLVPLAFRPTWLSFFSAIWSVGTVSGPLVGAGFSQNVSWRWIFYINLPLIGIGFVAIVLFLHQAKIPGGVLGKLARFDWLGATLFTAGSTSFLYGISTGGVSYPWGSFRVLVPLILGLFGLFLFGLWEFYFALMPVLDKRIFSSMDMILSYIMSVLHGAILWSLLYFMPLYYEGVMGFKPVIAAVAVLPETLTVAPAGAFVGIVAGITGHYRWSLWGGWGLTLLGTGLLTLLKPDTSTAAWIWLNIPIGIGTGMLFPALGLSIQASSLPELNGQAAAFFSFLRNFGQSIGVAISGVIFQNAFKKRLTDLPAFASVATAYSRDATSIVSILHTMPKGDDRTALIKAYSDSLRVIWISTIAFAAFCFVLSLFIRGSSLNQEHVTNQGLVERDTGNAPEPEKKQPEA